MAESLYTRRIGDGPDMVLLHGWGMHSGVWEQLAPILAKDYRVTLVDLPGHGYSRAAEQNHSLEDLVLAVAAVTPPSAIWIGWSLGGLIAQQLAIDHPERVSRLVLTASSPCFTRRPDWACALERDVLHQFAESLSSDYRNTLKRFIALEVRGSECAGEQLRRLRDLVFQRGDPNVQALSDGLAVLEHTDLRVELAALSCSVLILLGERDNLVPATVGTAMTELLADARVHIFERAGHAPFFSHLAEFVQRLRAFL